jgi:thioredoxin 1
MKLSDFQQEIENVALPVVVDFWAPWCVPCRTTKPILEALAEEFEGRVAFMAVNADESGEILAQYRILGIPTVLTFQEGRLVGRVTGAQIQANYHRLFEAALVDEAPQLPLAPFDRFLRLGAGVLLIGAGLFTDTWWLAFLGGVLAFLGVYDRCPVWQAVKTRLRPQ